MATATTTFFASPWLAQTKLRPPLQRADAVPRPRLLQAVAAAVPAHRLTLISAPAGAGKTTLLAALAREASSSALAWLALDEDDNDPAVFIQAVRAALRRVLPEISPASALPASADPQSELRQQIGVLINEMLAQARPVVLVLDDVHVIDSSAIHGALALLIERLPPHMHLVIATRSDPPLNLPRLRARRQLAEFRLPELRFSLDEAEQLLNTTTELHLDASQLRVLHERTDGWAAGITLLASSLDRMSSDGERAAFVDRVSRPEHAVWEYLAEEVLERQDPFTRMFLLETAVLPELTPAACEAVTGRSDAADVLADLYRRNLFLLALERADSDAAYRYHDLFAAFLRERLRREHPQWLRELHRRAAAVELQPSRRVQHLLQAELWDLAAGEVERAGEQMLRQGAVATLRGMLEALPPALRASRPRCTYLLAMCLVGSWQLAEARPLLERAYRELGATGDVAAQGLTLMQLADTLRMLGEYGPARQKTLAALELPLPPSYRIQLLATYAWQLVYEGDWQRQNAALDEMLDLLEHGGELDMRYSVAIGYRAPWIYVPGGVARAERFCRIVAASGVPADGPLEATLLGIRSMCSLLRGRMEQALAYAEQALEVGSRWGGLPWLASDVEPLGLLWRGLQGELGAVRPGLDELIERLARLEGSAAAWISVHLFLLGKLCWLHDDHEALRGVQLRIRAAANANEWPVGPIYRLKIEGLLAMAERRYPDAHIVLEQACAGQRQQLASRIGGDANVLLAYLHLCSGQLDAALCVFAPVLEEHEREDTPGYLLLEGAPIVPLLRLAAEHGRHAAFARRVLALLGEREEASATPPPAAPGLPDGETLTPREVEVLAMLAAGASNAAIAAALVISLHTVKRHVTNINAKLGVVSRLEAVAAARALGIV